MSVGFWGSKKRFATDIADHLCLEGRRKGSSSFYEPFCGMASVSLEVVRRGGKGCHSFRSVVMGDKDENVVEYWKGVKRGWLPSPSPLSVAKWSSFKKRGSPPSPARSFYGFDLGFGGKFLAGRRPNPSMNHETHLSRARERVEEASSLLRKGNVTILQQDFRSLRPERGSVLYCDPPYSSSTTDGGTVNRSQHFSEKDMADFWDAVRRWISLRCSVFLSASRLPSVPNDLRLLLVQEWTISNRIQTSKRGTPRKRKERLLLVEKNVGGSRKRSNKKRENV